MTPFRLHIHHRDAQPPGDFPILLLGLVDVELLYHTILCYAILYYTMLYYTMIYYIIV